MRTREECLALCLQQQHDTSHHEASDDRWCWHCCHPIPGMRIPLPIAYDDRTMSWTYVGQFCSWGCAKGYALDKQKLEWSQLLALLKRRMVGGKFSSITPAPPRRCLSVFGGTMSLDEFRSKSTEGIIVGQLPPRMMPLDQITTQRHVAPGKERRPDSNGARMAMTTEPKNETLRLKRPHAQTKKSTGLEMFLA